jgi:hypothetical protein
VFPVHLKFVALLSIAIALQPRALLDIPYLTQTPELCGGAAVAMVLRYWGERQVFAEDFASLVVPAERGIPTGALVEAVRARDWQVTVVGSDSRNPRSQIYAAIDRKQPLIALIEVAPRTYHYIVIAGATEKEIVVHDPARSPFRVLPWESFERAWAAAGRWMMLVLPPAADRDGIPPKAIAAPTGGTAGALTPCDTLVERGVALALGPDKDAAEEALVGATHVCPSTAAAWRELAGWRFSQQRWIDAREFAQTAVRLAPDDEHARELLATSRYLSGDVLGALDAWSKAGEPRIDLINVSGAERTRHPVIVNAAGLEPRQVLTSEAFARALRRLQALPVAASAGLRYEPIEGGLARVDASVNEREPYPRSWKTFGVIAGRAAVGQEVKLDFAGLFGTGERISASGRWQDERPRVALSLTAPAPSRLPGVASFDLMWERQSYPSLRESRRRAALRLTDWAASWLRWFAGIGIDRFDARRYISLGGSSELRLVRDRIALAASASEWFPRAGAERFGIRAVLVAWRSTADSTNGVWSALTELTSASHAAPLAVWEGAGTGSARPGLLRAHPLLDDRVLAGPVFGRRVARATLEYAHPMARTVAGTVSIAGFLDAAQAWHRLTPGASPLFIDAGAGVRLRMPGRGEVVRIDAAHGLRGGGARLSVGWVESWPR